MSIFSVFPTNSVSSTYSLSATINLGQHLDSIGDTRKFPMSRCLFRIPDGLSKGKEVRNHVQVIYLVFEIKAIVGSSKSRGEGSQAGGRTREVREEVA